MPTKVLTAKHPEQAALIPADDDAAEALKAYKVGETFEITTTVWVRKTDDGILEGESEADCAFLDRYGAGELVELTVNKKRNLKHHRLAMVMFRAVFENQDKYTDFERFLIEVKILTGFVDTHISASGQVWYVVKSIAFPNMDEVAFRKWKNDALNAIFEHFLPAMNDADRNRLEHYLLALS